MAFAFKEWSLVCEALGRGEQHLLLRKGGIAEGRNGFGFLHSNFYLFPTFFHGQIEKISSRLDRDAWSKFLFNHQNSNDHIFSYTVEIQDTYCVKNRNTLYALDPLHIFDRSLLDERFEYQTKSSLSPCIYVALVKVYCLQQKILLPDNQKYSGCKSWLDIAELPDISTVNKQAVISDTIYQEKMNFFYTICKNTETLFKSESKTLKKR